MKAEELAKKELKEWKDLGRKFKKISEYDSLEATERGYLGLRRQYHIEQMVEIASKKRA